MSKPFLLNSATSPYLELLDEGEDVAVVLAQELSKMLAAVRLNTLFGDGASAGKGLVDLVVELDTVGDDEEGVVAGKLATAPPQGTPPL